MLFYVYVSFHFPLLCRTALYAPNASKMEIIRVTIVSALFGFFNMFILPTFYSHCCILLDFITRPVLGLMMLTTLFSVVLVFSFPCSLSI